MTLAMPVADHTADPVWRAITSDLKALLVRLAALDPGSEVIQEQAPSSTRSHAA